MLSACANELKLQWVPARVEQVLPSSKQLRSGWRFLVSWQLS